MGPDLELTERSGMVMEASSSKENGNVMKESEDKYMRCAFNYEDDTFEMDRNKDVDLNIIEHRNSGDIVPVEVEGQDATENSSSFGGTISEGENGTMSNDAELESELCGDATSSLTLDGCGEVFRMRKKKLTSHWRTYIRPIMWRCKWVELQIKKFQSQAIKYDRELAEYNQAKQFDLENFSLEDFGAKSLPFSSQSRRKTFMRRNKRKRVEETMDVVSYMSRHNLFSYYENKRSAASGTSMDDHCGNLVISADKAINGNDDFGANDEILSLELKYGDDSLEQILWKIGNVQTQVSKLKTRIDKVMSENAGRFSSADNLSLLVPCNALTGSSQNPASPSNRMRVGSSYIASQLISEYNDMGDLIMPESAVSSHGEVIHLPDMIESTDQPLVGGLCKNAEDGFLLYNQRAQEELNNFEEVKILPVEKPQVVKKEQDSTDPQVTAQELDLPTDDQPPRKIRSISKLTAPKNKRKRGRRKAGSGRWSRKSSG
ncbi:uncharacterized protein LOC132276448 isoform X2 [Cornus florida]|uniref:uncharacterized protein LOC132276448 isoform X2 n=1 Tax=Cornus florida TaxID=4283 RepID=UPI00289A085B|nr:uncharacterized protein LOC132276448 isoform X2 [Cornus florida]